MPSARPLNETQSLTEQRGVVEGAGLQGELVTFAQLVEEYRDSSASPTHEGLARYILQRTSAVVSPWGLMHANEMALHVYLENNFYGTEDTSFHTTDGNLRPGVDHAR